VTRTAVSLQMVAHRENDLARPPIQTDDVDYLRLLNTHFASDKEMRLRWTKSFDSEETLAVHYIQGSGDQINRVSTDHQFKCAHFHHSLHFTI